MNKFFLIFLFISSLKASELLNIISSNNIFNINRGKIEVIVSTNKIETPKIIVNFYPDIFNPREADLKTGELDQNSWDKIIYVKQIKYLPAAEVINNVRSFLDKNGYIAANNDNNSLLIADFELNVKHIINIIEEIDKPFLPENSTYIIKKENSEEIARVINTILGGDTNYIFATSFNEFLIVKTDDYKIKEIRDIVDKLNSPVRELNFEKIKLKNIYPLELQDQISVLFTNTISVADERTSSILLLSPPKELDKIYDFIVELDRVNTEKKIHIIQVENTNSLEIIRNILESIKK